jgi:shikimate dehydrogenase
VRRNKRKIFLIGKNIGYSISPQIQNAAFKKLGINAKYELLDVGEKQFDKMLQKISKSPDTLGFNVTIPYKERIIDHLSEMDQKSQAIGAVNTVKVQRGGILTGFNTDCDGIKATLNTIGISSGSGKHAIILGAGGASKACIFTLAEIGFESICILNRTASKAQRVVEHFRRQFPKIEISRGNLTEENLHKYIKTCDLLINAIGHSTRNYFPTKLDFSTASDKMKVFDLGYKDQSLLLSRALEMGLEAVDGLQMLVEQAVKSIAILTGKTPPRKLMMTVARKTLRKE